MRKPEDAAAFARAMRKVEPLGEGAARVAARRRRAASAAPVAAVEFELTQSGNHHQGRAVGVASEEIDRLEVGDYAPELTVDLHGLTAEAARAEVARGLRHARAGGLRVVRIVHGRGLRSAAGPVLKEALPKWLAAPPHGRSVLAFTSTGRHGASGGATLVLLRKP